METKEKNFEDSIEDFFLSQAGGYVKGNQATYDKSRAIDMAVLMTFILNTQPKVWQRFVNNYGDGAEKQLTKFFKLKFTAKA